MDREIAIKEIESYITDISFSTTAKSAKYPSVETLKFCLNLLKEENLIRKEDLMSLIKETNFGGAPHWRKEKMLDELIERTML